MSDKENDKEIQHQRSVGFQEVAFGEKFVVEQVKQSLSIYIKDEELHACKYHVQIATHIEKSITAQQEPIGTQEKIAVTLNRLLLQLLIVDLVPTIRIQLASNGLIKAMDPPETQHPPLESIFPEPHSETQYTVEV